MEEEIFFAGFVLAIVLICGSQAAEAAAKRKDFQSRLKSIADEHEQKAVEWYVLSLKRQERFAPILLVIFIGLFAIFREEIMRFNYYQVSMFFSGVLLLAVIVTKRSRKSMGYHMEKDKRRPVLYLRPFDIDKDALELGFKQFQFAANELFKTSATVIGKAGLLGPVVAIADPVDPNKKDAFFASDTFNDWRGKVAQLMQDASLIVFRAYDTEGVIWEFKQIISRGYLQKTVLFIHASEKTLPDYLKRYESFRSKILETTGVDPGEHNPRLPIVCFDENNEAWAADDYFEIPAFRKAFYKQVIMRGKIAME